MLPPDGDCAAPLTADLGVDAVYVLSVRSFHDRIAHVMRELKKHVVPFEFIFDFAIEDITPNLLKSRFGPSNLGLPQQSLVLKHMHAWRLALERRQSRIVVFEDDVILRRRFTPGLRAALRAIGDRTAWLIFLGGGDTKVPNWFFLERGPLVPMPIATAEGYVTDLAACQRRLEWCNHNLITVPADHLIRHVDATMGIAQYWLTEPIVEQGSVTGRFASTLDAQRQKHTRFVNGARNRWNKLQRRNIRKWWVRLRNGS